MQKKLNVKDTDIDKNFYSKNILGSGILPITILYHWTGTEIGHKDALHPL